MGHRQLLQSTVHLLIDDGVHRGSVILRFIDGGFHEHIDRARIRPTA